MARFNTLETQGVRRFPDEAFSLAHSPPAKDQTPRNHDFSGSHCPFCKQQILPARTSITSQFVSGVRRLVLAFGVILSAVLRLVRFLVGGCFCVVGFVGSLLPGVGITNRASRGSAAVVEKSSSENKRRSVKARRFHAEVQSPQKKISITLRALCLCVEFRRQFRHGSRNY